EHRHGGAVEHAAQLGVGEQRAAAADQEDAGEPGRVQAGDERVDLGPGVDRGRDLRDELLGQRRKMFGRGHCGHLISAGAWAYSGGEARVGTFSEICARTFSHRLPHRQDANGREMVTLPARPAWHGWPTGSGRPADGAGALSSDDVQLVQGDVRGEPARVQGAYVDRGSPSEVEIADDLA